MENQKISLNLEYNGGRNVARLIQKTDETTVETAIQSWDANDTPTDPDDLLYSIANKVRDDITGSLQIDTSRVRWLRPIIPYRFGDRPSPHGTLFTIGVSFGADPEYPELTSIRIYKDGRPVEIPVSYHTGNGAEPSECAVRRAAIKAVQLYLDRALDDLLGEGV